MMGMEKSSLSHKTSHSAALEAKLNFAALFFVWPPFTPGVVPLTSWSMGRVW